MLFRELYAYDSRLGIETIMSYYIHKKRGASPVTRSTYLGLRIALSVETSNAESPTPM